MDRTAQPFLRFLPVAAFLYGCLAAAVFAFVLYGRQGMIEPVVDLNGFGLVSRHIALGDGFSLGYGPTTRRAPLYPYFGAALLYLFGDPAARVPEAVLFRPLIVANCVLFGLTCVVVYRIASRLFGWRAGLLAIIACPIVPQSLRYVGMTEVETLMGLFIALLAWTGLKLAERPSWRTGAVFGVCAAAATLTKPIVLLYPIAFALLVGLHWWRRRSPLRPAASALAMMFACFGVLLLPWSLRNSAVTNGTFKGISSNGPGEFIRGYVNAQPKYFLLRQDFGGGGPGEKWDPEANLYEEALLRPHGIPFYRPVRDADGNTTFTPTPPPGSTSASIEVQKDRVESVEMKRRLLHEPLGFVRKFVVQLATFWYIVETTKKSMLVGSIALTVLGFAAAGVVHARRRGKLVWPVVSVLLYFNAIYAAFLAFARYSMPLYPTLIALAAGGGAWLLSRFLPRWFAEDSVREHPGDAARLAS